jgi:hypothetical protein
VNSGSIDWQAVEAAGVWVTVLVLIAAAFYARSQVDVARRSREEQTRPYVVLDLDAQSRPPLVNLIISNIGATVAKNVKFRFDPDLVSSLDGRTDTTIGELRIFAEGIPWLAPRRRSLCCSIGRRID